MLMSNRILFAAISVALAASQVALAQVSSTTISFQEGVNGYTGVAEKLISTSLAAELPSATNLTPANWFVDGGGTAASPDQQALIRFDNIIGSSRIPAGATILDASFQLTTGPVDPLVGGNANAGTGGYVGLTRLTSAFTPSTTYINYGALGPYYGTGFAARPTAGFVDLADGQVDVDSAIDADQVVSTKVTQYVQAWSSGETNHGLAVQHGRPQGTTDGWMIGTSFNADTARRPKLTVKYTTDVVETATFQQGVNGYTGSSQSWLKQNNNSGANEFLDGSLLNQSFLDGPATGSPDDQSLIKFDNLFANAGGSIPADAEIIDAALVITTGSSSANALTRGGFDVHQMNVDWDVNGDDSSKPSYFSEFSGGAGPSGTDISPILDTKAALLTDAEAYFDVTQAVAAWKAGDPNFGLNIQASINNADGWQVFFNGATDVNARPRLMIRYSLGAAGQWAVDANGEWSVITNWLSERSPNGAGKKAVFGSVITAARTVTVDSAQTIGIIDFDSAQSYTIAGTATLTLDAATETKINVLAGSHTISAPVTLAKPVIIDTATATTLTMSGALTATGQSITKTGDGSFRSTNIRTNTLAVNGGTVQILAGGGNAATSVVNELSIAAGASLDVTDAAIIVDYAAADPSPFDDVKAAIVSARINSSLTTSGRAVGMGTAADLAISSFGGQAVDADAVLVQFTLVGDANLDKAVNFDDLLRLAQAYNASDAEWSNGDSNYDNLVNFDDLLGLAQNYGASLLANGETAVDESMATRFGSDWALALSVVPEPTTFAIAAMGSLVVRRRRA